LRIFKRNKKGAQPQEKKKEKTKILTPAISHFFLRILTTTLKISLFLLAIFIAYRFFRIVFTLHNFLFVFKYLFVSFLAFFALWLLFITLQELLRENEETFSQFTSLIKSFRYKLAIFQGDIPQRELILDKPYYTLGRGQTCDIIIDEACVSRKHCQIVVKNERYHLLDDDSRNGTYVNGERVGNIPVLLQDGDEISLGATGKDIKQRIVFEHVKKQ